MGRSGSCWGWGRWCRLLVASRGECQNRLTTIFAVVSKTLEIDYRGQESMSVSQRSGKNTQKVPLRPTLHLLSLTSP